MIETSGLLEEEELLMSLTQLYLEWEQKTTQESKSEGRKEGRTEGRKEEGRLLILKLLNRKFGSISSENRSQIESLSLEHLETLCEALLDFSTPDDLRHWLQRHG